ncbi:hypothetical protein HEP87_17950 [Streptomyces sp. S1D4-11]
MSETSTMEPLTTDAHEATAQDEGHGKHRGPVSGRDDEATPMAATASRPTSRAHRPDGKQDQ